jgi:hypothetical protein
MLAGYNYSEHPILSARADALIAQMTPDEKAGQLSQFFLLPDDTDDE